MIEAVRRVLVLVLIVVSSPATPVSASPSNDLIGQVGLHDAFRISLTLPNGRPVRSIPAGTYTFVIHDYSSLHNFALGSITQNRRIFTGSIHGTGTETYIVKLTPGRYAYACSAHPTIMNGAFQVTAAP
jgi:hypothetical protein